MWCAIDVNNLFPLIVIVLIVFVSLLRAIFKAFSAKQKQQPTGRQQARPSVWGEFKKALQQMAEQQRQGGRGPVEPEEQEEGGEVSVEEHPVGREEPGQGAGPQVIIVTPTRRPYRRISEQPPVVRPVPHLAPLPVPMPSHRPEDLGSGISREVSRIVHPPLESHLMERGLAPQPPGPLQRPGLLALLHLAGASPVELRKAILLQEIMSTPLAERMPGSPWVR